MLHIKIIAKEKKMEGLNVSAVEKEEVQTEENVLAGAVGAFLFALVGGVLWFALYMCGFLAGISGIIGVVCAIKGYSVFGKNESKKGIVISVLMTIIVLALSWYLCLGYDIYDAYNMWYENGEIDYTLSFFESVRVAPEFLADPEIGPAYFGDLAIGLLLSVVGVGSYLVKKSKKK